jgi:hypothetical protein
MLDFISLVSFFVLGITGWITYKIFIWPFYVSPLRKIPGPSSEGPFYGNLKEFLSEDVIYYLYISNFNISYQLIPIVIYLYTNIFKKIFFVVI